MAHELTFEEIQNCKKVFDEFKNPGEISMEYAKMNLENLQKALRGLKFVMENQELDDVCQSMNLGSEIDFPTFLRIAAIKFKQKEFVDALQDAFKAFDKNNKGYLTYDELRSIITDFGPKVSMDTADSLLKELGLQADRKFKYEDFVKKNI